MTGLTRAIAVGVLTATAGTAGPASTAGTAPAVIGGPQLAGTGVIVNYPAGHAPKLPGIKASAWVIADAATGQVLAAKDPHGWYRPASTLKVLTAVALIPALNPASSVVASKLAASQTPNDIGLLAGHQYQVAELFTALLTISANDAAVALAEGTGSYARGMSLINAAARHLQADDTVAQDPNGLDEPGQRTSAYDLALIARQALTMPAFMKYDTVRGGLFPIKPHKSVGLWNQNGLLTQYRGGIGGKIGWTSAAGATYVGMARRNGVTLIVSLLHCPALTEIISAEKLLDWGFAEDGKVKPVGTLVSPGSASAASTAPGSSGASGSSGAHGAAPAGQGHASPVSHSALTSPSVLVAVSFAGLIAVAAALGIARARRRLPERRR